MNYSLSGRGGAGRQFNTFQSMSNDDNKFNKTVNDMFGIGQKGFGIYNTIANGAGNSIPWLGAALGLVNSGRTALGGGSFRDDVPQSFFGIDNKNDSDVMQSLKGTADGAMKGAAIGSIVPGIGTAIGAIIGGALGLGSSFLDDI